MIFFRKRNKGFSLIEIAIALSVIGILMGLSLKGRDLVELAKIRALIAQIENYKSAVQIFYEKYGALPGDFKEASIAISNDLSDGYETGIIETKEDAQRFWSHLTKDGFSSAKMSDGFPTTKLGGILSVSNAIAGLDGLWIIWCDKTSDNKDFSPITTEKIAYKINKSMDNGEPDSGDVNVIKKGSSSKDTIMLFRIW